MGMNFFRFKHLHSDGEVQSERIHRNTKPNTLIFSCFLLYTAMMAAKGVFLAEITYIMQLFDIDKATASLTNTYYFVTYAGMQVLLFFVVKKIDLRKFLLCTVPIAAVSTMLMGFSRSIVDMWILFSVSGLFQAGVYCGANNTLTKYLPSSYLSRANKIMNLGYATGTVISYAVCATFIKFELWSVPFFILGGVFLFAVIFYAICALGCNEPEGSRAATVAAKTDVEEDKPLFTIDSKRKKFLFYTVDLVLAFLITSLYYAIMNWITTLLVDVHNMSQDISIYITILAPTLIALGPMMTIRSCDKHRDFVGVGIKYLCFVLPIPLLLAFLYDVNVIIAFVLSVLFVIGINGVKAIVLSIIAFKMRTTVNTAEYTCISNAVASLAGGVAPTLVGKVIDSFGWSVSYLAVFGLCALVLVALLIVDVTLRSFGEENARKRGAGRCYVDKNVNKRAQNFRNKQI